MWCCRFGRRCTRGTTGQHKIASYKRSYVRSSAAIGANEGYQWGGATHHRRQHEGGGRRLLRGSRSRPGRSPAPRTVASRRTTRFKNPWALQRELLLRGWPEHLVEHPEELLDDAEHGCVRLHLPCRDDLQRGFVQPAALHGRGEGGERRSKDSAGDLPRSSSYRAVQRQGWSR